MEIRLAREEDCRSLALLKRRVWESTYRGIYPNEKLDKYNIDSNENKFKQMIKQQSQKLFVVLENLEIIGYMSCGKIMRAFEEYTHDIGLLYLSNEHQGRGIGAELFQVAKEELKNQGAKEFIVSCNKCNLPAQQFYIKMGGEVVKIEEDKEDKSIPQIKFLYRR